MRTLLAMCDALVLSRFSLAQCTPALRSGEDLFLLSKKWFVGSGDDPVVTAHLTLWDAFSYGADAPGYACHLELFNAGHTSIRRFSAPNTGTLFTNDPYRLLEHLVRIKEQIPEVVNEIVHELEHHAPALSTLHTIQASQINGLSRLRFS